MHPGFSDFFVTEISRHIQQEHLILLTPLAIRRIECSSGVIGGVEKTRRNRRRNQKISSPWALMYSSTCWRHKWKFFSVSFCVLRSVKLRSCLKAVSSSWKDRNGGGRRTPSVAVCSGDAI
ncbi:hypothetical protein A2U01_0050760, partial [Trifolium medium]|nr:hypothetical protein [Trifolium medium]